MKIQNATIEDVFKDLLDGKPISDYFILTLTKFSNENLKRNVPKRTIQAKSVEKTPVEVLKEIVKQENRCLVKIDRESE